MGKRYKKSTNSPRPRPLLFGVHAVVAALKNSRRSCQALYVTSKSQNLLTEHGVTCPENCALKVVEPFFFEDILGPNAVHQFIALEAQALIPPPLDFLYQKEKSLVLVLDQVTDPHNVGAILRSCAAFQADAVIVQDKHSPNITGTLAKSACGGIEVVPVISVTNLSRTLQDLQNAGFFCLGLDERGEMGLSEARPAPKTALVLGAEGRGIRRLVAETCDMLVHLPTSAKMRSLNVSNAAAIALYILADKKG